jgi:Fe/S biogenesis protein NfuA
VSSSCAATSSTPFDIASLTPPSRKPFTVFQSTVRGFVQTHAGCHVSPSPAQRAPSLHSGPNRPELPVTAGLPHAVAPRPPRTVLAQGLGTPAAKIGYMSTESADTSDLEERVSNFLRRNFPQIQMHGGSAAIQHLDPEAGEVTIMLGGACSGCGISPMTIQAIKSRMVKEIPEIETVHADTGMGGGGGGGGPGGDSPSFPGETVDDDDGESDEGPQAPF